MAVLKISNAQLVIIQQSPFGSRIPRKISIGPGFFVPIAIFKLAHKTQASRVITQTNGGEWTCRNGMQKFSKTPYSGSHENGKRIDKFLTNAAKLYFPHAE
jgi:hypothetical protein